MSAPAVRANTRDWPEKAQSQEQIAPKSRRRATAISSCELVGSSRRGGAFADHPKQKVDTLDKTTLDALRKHFLENTPWGKQCAALEKVVAEGFK